MSVTTQSGSARHYVTGPGRLCTCAGRQFTGFGRQWGGVTYIKVVENGSIAVLFVGITTDIKVFFIKSTLTVQPSEIFVAISK